MVYNLILCVVHTQRLNAFNIVDITWLFPNYDAFYVDIQGCLHGNMIFFSYNMLIGGFEHLDYFPFHIWDVILFIDFYFSDGWVYHQPATICWMFMDVHVKLSWMSFPTTLKWDLWEHLRKVVRFALNAWRFEAPDGNDVVVFGREVLVSSAWSSTP